MSQGIIKLEDRITEDFIEEISHRLSEKKRIRRTLPAHGRLNIDRRLPFLYVYRRPHLRPDNGTDQLVKGEAAYLIIPDAPKFKTEVSGLVKAIVKNSSQDTGSFLIVEIWSRETPISIIDPDKGRTAPSFHILVSSSRIPVETVEAIEQALRRITISKNRGIVSTTYTRKPWPEKQPPLLTSSDIHKYNCYLIGIEISPIYRDPDSLEVFPFVLNKIHRGMSIALKKGAFAFSQKRTTIRPESYKSLGRRAVVKAVWEVDHRLAEISNIIDFLVIVTPVNIDQSWSKFKGSKFQKEPLFYYRPISFDPSLLKRRLYEIPFDRIEDPTLSAIFHEKLFELELKFSMIRDRNTRNFFFGSMSLYGEIDDGVVELAKKILGKLPPHSREAPGTGKINAAKFADRARKEIDFYREVCPEIGSKVFIRDDITGLMVSKGNLLIGRKVRVPESRVEALIQHEVGTHILTYVNGLNQPFQQLYCGLAGSDELQEGLAVLSEYMVGGLSAPRLRLLAGRVIAAKSLIDGASFIETFRELYYTFGFAQRTAYIITSRIFRGGGFTKDAIYLRGLVKLVDYLRRGGKLEPLLVGKISIKDISLINELQLRKVLKPAFLSPRYIRNPESLSKLDGLRQGQLICNLI